MPTVAIVFGERQIDLSDADGALLVDVREAFGFPEQGVLAVTTASGALRPVVTLPHEPVPVGAHEELQFVVSADDGAQEQQAIVRKLLALGAGANTADARGALQPYRPAARPAHAGTAVPHAAAYDPLQPVALCRLEYTPAHDDASARVVCPKHGEEPDAAAVAWREGDDEDDVWGVMTAVA